MTQAQLRKIFSRHYGAVTKLAIECGVHKTMISGVLRGRAQSQRISDAIHNRAMELLDRERAELAASQQ